MSSPESERGPESKKSGFLKTLGTIALAAAGVVLFFGPHGLLKPKHPGQHHK